MSNFILMKTKQNNNENNEINDYINKINNNILSKVRFPNRNQKISDDNVIITIDEYFKLLHFNYNVSQLKILAKHYQLKISGNKNELLNRIYCFLYLSNIIIKIQKILRGHLLRKYINCHGPAFYNKSLCINENDFLTMEKVNTIKNSQFFSYKDEYGFIYGFDIMSFYNLIQKNKIVKNPYNSNIIDNEIIEKFKNLIILSKIFKDDIIIEIEPLTNKDISENKSIELRALTLFQTIDSLGNYSNVNWFYSLSKLQLYRLVRELIDIWNYRTPLTIETRKEICPPHGNPFINVSLGQLNSYVYQENGDIKLKQSILEILENFVNKGINKDSQCLGAYYVLGALTIVNEEVAQALPWLYQAFYYN